VIRGWLIACLVVWSSAAAAVGLPAGYVLDASVALDPGYSGIAGRVELLRDAEAEPRKPVRLRVVEAGGAVLDEQVFEPAMAALEAVDLYGTGPVTYLLRLDYGAGRGAYWGLTSLLLEVRRGRLQQLSAINSAGANAGGDGAAEPMALMSNLRSGWVLIADGAGKAILSARSRPHLEDPLVREGLSGDSVILFRTYRFHDGRWWFSERHMLGDWEDGGEDSWPDRRLFP
jgi:hypothetical protein